LDSKVDDLLQCIRTLERELEVRMALAQAELGGHLENGKIEFVGAVRW